MQQPFTFAPGKVIQKRLYMRFCLTVTLLACFIWQGSASTFAQSNLTLNRQKVTLKEVFEAIKSQTEYEVFYSSNRVNDRHVVKADFNDSDVREVLQACLEGLPLTYVIKENTIVIKETPANPSAATTQQVSAAQQHLVRRRVLSQAGDPLEGASVTIKGTRQTVTSAADGTFSIPTDPNDILVVSYVGYLPAEQAVSGRTSIHFTLESEVHAVDEVVVVAFGTAKRSTYTGSAAVVGAESFQNRPITEISQALTATTPGVQVGTSNGQPGSEPTIRIRGIGSFNAGNSPLIILDGMPYDNAFSSINPNDVESVTVLKDASSAALYGARGANGVLMVTTKKGRAGKTILEAKYNLGLTSRQSTDYDRLNDRDYMELY